MGKVFKTNFLSALVEAWEHNQLDFFGAAQKYENLDNLRQLMNLVANKKWVVWCEAPINGVQQIYDYLARYVHRPAMADSRINRIENERIFFSCKDYQDRDQTGKATVKETSLSIMDFIQRFLLHILPKGFQKVRYNGLMSSAAKNTKLQQAFKILGHTIQHTMRTIKQILKQLLSRDVDICQACGASHFVTNILLTNRKWMIHNIKWNPNRAPLSYIIISHKTPFF